VFTAWGNLDGVEYVYEAADDGVALSFLYQGILGTRADIRIAGHFVDGQSGPNILACNFFPNTGDMIIDTGNTTFFGAADTTGLRNVLSHEHGHGTGLRHSCPNDHTKLMEPFVSTAFDGPQEDDILAANRAYGDALQSPSSGGDNNSVGTAVALAAVVDGVVAIETAISIDASSDEDWFSVTIPAESRATVIVTPTGSIYPNAPQNLDGSCPSGTPFDALLRSDIAVELRGLGGVKTLARSTRAKAGEVEAMYNVALNEGAGTYYVRVFNDGPDQAQMYDLSLALVSPPSPLLCAAAPVAGCLEASQAQLQYQESSAGKEKMKLRWKKIGSVTTLAAFGDPVRGLTSVAACVYDDSDTLVVEHSINRGGAACAGASCWKNKGSTGYGVQRQGELRRRCVKDRL